MNDEDKRMAALSRVLFFGPVLSLLVWFLVEHWVVTA
jgi:hypothetical protein